MGRLFGAFCATSAAVLWGSTYPAIAIAAREAGPISIALVRGVLQSAILAVVLLLVRPALPAFDRRSYAALAGVAVLGAFFNVGQSASVAFAGAAVGGFVTGLYPVIASVTGAWLAREQRSRSTTTALLICVVGLAMITLPSSGSTSQLGGVLMGAIAAAAFGVFLPASRKLMVATSFSPLVVTLAVFLALTLEAGLGVALVGDAGLPRAPSAPFVVAMGWLIVGGGITPLLLVQLALRYSPTMTVAPYLFLAPAVSVILSFAIVGDAPSRLSILGGTLIVIGLVVQTLGESGLPRPRWRGLRLP
jgi:drug/metabolite transporter (DMT)-like permease